MGSLTTSSKDLIARLGSNTALSSVTEGNAIVLVASTALFVHVIFNRWEPKHIAFVLPLLVILPVASSALLVPHFGYAIGLLRGLLVFYATLSSSIILYRISPFHPIASYPGPLLAKVSRLWHLYKTFGGQQHLYIRELHEQYGDIVRIGPNEVSIRDPACIVPLLGSLGCPKGPMYNGRQLWPQIPALIGYQNSAIHHQRRKPWNRAFNTSSLKEFEPRIHYRVSELVDALEERQGQVVDLAQWIGFFTYDFMGDMIFGGWTNMIKAGADHNGFWGLLKRGIRMAHVFENLPWLSYYAKHIPGVGGDLKLLRKMCFSQTEKRVAAGATTKDVFYFLSNEDGADKVSPPKEIVVADGALALIAGSDTTTTVTASTFYCLLRHPAAFERLRAEVDEFYPPGEDSLNTKHHSHMPFLEAVVNEGLRLFPAVPSGSQRAPEAGKGGKVIGPYFIPEGTAARIHFWSVQRDARNFSHPDTFWPERWLIAEGLEEHAEKIEHNPSAWTPFSFGPSNCVGKNMALQEIRTLICHLVQRLTVRLPEGYNPDQYEKDLHDRFVFTIGKLPVILEKREQR